MLKHNSEFPSFLRLNNVPLCICTIFCSSTHLLIGTWIASSFWLLWIMLLWAQVYKYLFDFLLSVLWGMFPEVKLLDHVGLLFLMFGGAAILFSIIAVPFYILTNSAQKFQPLHILATTCYLLSDSFFRLLIVLSCPYVVKSYQLSRPLD